MTIEWAAFGYSDSFLVVTQGRAFDLIVAVTRGALPVNGVSGDTWLEY